MRIIQEKIDGSLFHSRILQEYFDKKDIVVADIETTGLSPRNSQVVLGGLLIQDGEDRQAVQFFADRPEDEEELRNEGSYPSGHTVRGWGAALVLSTINPARQNEILTRGYEYGQSRVIAGFHYQSDVDAARMAASACYARMQNDKLFRKQMKRAQREFKKKYRIKHQ